MAAIREEWIRRTVADETREEDEEGDGRREAHEPF